ncbi:hypothetical protein MVEG_10391 [Podila verticillata NRRL 6337]|nr:hypothetical protein MVEG_10391 [Podila verticillata NRRL 6337]
MRVSIYWSSAFKPHVWKTVKLPSIASLTNSKISTILENKHWIRSLTLDARHIEQVSCLVLTTLQELVLYSENFEKTEDGNPVRELNVGFKRTFSTRLACGSSEYGCDAVIALMDNNPDLERLEICLLEHIYYSGVLSPSLMLATERHSSLKDSLGDFQSIMSPATFFQCLLSVCQKSIQELEVDYFCYTQPYCAQFGNQCVEWYIPDYVTSFSADGRVERFNDDYYYDNDDNTSIEESQTVYPAYTELANLTYPLDKLGLSALRSVHMAPGEFHLPNLAPLHPFPHLQDVHIDAHHHELELIVQFLSSCSTLRGIDLRTIAHHPTYY